jgi:signal transduction histidine kinase
MFDDWIDKFLQRLLLVALMPNVLVWGFWEIGIDNSRNPLWFGLIGPYWFLEKMLVAFALSGVVLFLLWKALQFVPPIIDSLIRLQQEWRATKSAAYFEHENKRMLAELTAESQARQAAFKALPIEEQREIERERQERGQARQLERQKAHEESLRRELAKAEQLKREKEAAAERKRAIENTPEFQRQRALRQFTGGGGR